MKRLLPWLIVAVMAAWAVASLRPAPETGFRDREFAELPVLMNGRIQPFDSVARNSLLQLRGKQTAPIKLHFSVFDPARRGQLMSADQWLLELMANPTLGDTRKVFRIDNPELVDLLKLPEKNPDQGEDGMHYSFKQLEGKLDELGRQGERIQNIEAANRTPFEKQVVKLQTSLSLYQRLKATLVPPDSTDFAADLTRFEESIKPGLAAVEAQRKGEKFDPEGLRTISEFFTRFSEMAQFATVRPVPPNLPSVSRDHWETVGTNLMQVLQGAPISPAVRAYASMVSAYRQNNPPAFNTALDGYTQWLNQNLAPELAKGRREFFYNDFQFFYKALSIYVLAFIFACVTWFSGTEWLRRSALYLVVLAALLHTAGIIFRMVLEGRPPVTNLYSSAVFIGWGTAVLGIVLERIYRDGLGSAIASLIGFITLVIAHNLALAGDTMEMLRAVLDTNFWLATHVVTVTLGYSATFAAGFLAMFYLLRGVFTRGLTTEIGRTLSRMVYGIVCFATLFSFIGTVLGGIWADQSWGRFWGWDPKENGALMIVLWNAAILHARWGGWIRDRGLMNMALFGNIVTSFSWFGVNMLGVGLHSYGFMDSAFNWLMLFVGSQVALIGLGLLPLKHWRSFQTPATPAVPPSPDSGTPSPAPAGV